MNWLPSSKKQVLIFETNAKSMSDIFDDVKENTERELNFMKAETKRLDNLISDNRKEQGIKDSEIQQYIVNLKSRSMRDNLVFCGIHEERDEDDCEQVVRKFLRDKLKNNG
jgi:phage-related protein